VTAVVDASVLTAALIDAGSGGRWAESIIGAGSLIAPELVLVETTNVLRRLERTRDISTFEATGAQRDLLRLDLELFPYAPFAERVWELRSNLTTYDAWYVALAEAFECPLATLDGKLSRAAGVKCKFSTP
jgi:predicted nucleic acid-binding protein